jgi:hypothetical protein
VHDIAVDHLAEVRARIAGLRRMERVLATIGSRGPGIM